MSRYDTEYYVLLIDQSESIPEPVSDAKTKSHRIRDDHALFGPQPFVFKNMWESDMKEDGIEETIPLLLCFGPQIIVRSAVKEGLEFIGVNNAKYHPSIYIDINEDWHEDYWFQYFDHKLDCWDRQASEYKPTAGGKDPEIIKYSLSSALLDDIPEEDRLIFIIGGTALPRLFVHQKVIDYFNEASVRGWRAIKVSEYEFKMEF